MTTRDHAVGNRALTDAPDQAARPPGGAIDLVRLDVEVALLTIHQGRLGVLVTRGVESGPAEQTVGQWRLPSAVVPAHQDPSAVADDLLVRLGVSSAAGPNPTARSAMFIEQLRTYAGPGRGAERFSGDDRSAVSTPASVRVVSIAYVALVAELGTSKAFSPRGPRAAPLSSDVQTRIFAVDDLEGAGMLAMDHDQILLDAVERVRSKFEYTTVATSLVLAPFTIPELRRVYEAVWGTSLHQANFRRKVLATPGFVIPADDPVTFAPASDPCSLPTEPNVLPAGGPNPVSRGDALEALASGKPDREPDRRGPDLYQRGVAVLLHPAMLRPGGPGGSGTEGID
jgi:8-oxo-dGTP diphosphatase